MSELDRHEGDIESELAAQFTPTMESLGFWREEATPRVLRFKGATARLDVRYVPRDGDLDVRLIPDDGAGEIDLKLFLAKFHPEFEPVLLRAVESREEALELAADVVDALPAAADLIRGDARLLATARSLRWWSSLDDLG